MSSTSSNKIEKAEKEEVIKTDEICFVIMPISDQPDYEPQHFTRVYKDIIAPSCRSAGYIPDRADDTEGTNIIHLEIIKKLIEAPMAICDLSSRNPNVMFELGIRQAFDKPVVLIKDDRTIDIFDVAPLRSMTYKSALKYHEVVEAQASVAKALKATARQAGDKSSVNSLIRLMELHTKAKLDSVSSDPVTSSIIILQEQIRFLTQEISSNYRNQRNDNIYEIRSNEIEKSTKRVGGIATPEVLFRNQVFRRFRTLPLGIQDEAMKKVSERDRKILTLAGIYEASSFSISALAMEMNMSIDETRKQLREAIEAVNEVIRVI